EFDFDDLDVGRLDDSADEFGFDREFAVAAIDQDEELDAGRAAVVEEGVEGGSDGAAGVEYVVHQDDVLAGDFELNVGSAYDRLDIDGAEIVAIEVDIEDAHGDLAIFERLDFARQPLGQRYSAAAD